MASVQFIGDHVRLTPPYRTRQRADAPHEMASIRSSHVDEGDPSIQPQAPFWPAIIANDGFCELCGFYH
jgi:hypothetical protein